MQWCSKGNYLVALPLVITSLFHFKSLDAAFEMLQNKNKTKKVGHIWKSLSLNRWSTGSVAVLTISGFLWETGP